MKKLIGCIAVTIFIVVMISAQSTTSPVGGQGYGSWGSPIYAIWSDSAGWSIYADSAGTAVFAYKADSLWNAGAYRYGNNFFRCDVPDTIIFGSGDTIFTFTDDISLYIAHQGTEDAHGIYGVKTRIQSITGTGSIGVFGGWFQVDSTGSDIPITGAVGKAIGGKGVSQVLVGLKGDVEAATNDATDVDMRAVVGLTRSCGSGIKMCFYGEAADGYASGDSTWVMYGAYNVVTQATNSVMIGSEMYILGGAGENDTCVAVIGTALLGAVNIGGQFDPLVYVITGTDTTEITGTTVTTDTFFGVLGNASNCFDVYVDSLHSCSDIWVCNNMWMKAGDTLWFRDASLADTSYIVQDGGTFTYDSDNTYEFNIGGTIKFRITNTVIDCWEDLAGIYDDDDIQWDGKWGSFDHDGDDSLCGIIFNAADSIKYDSIGQALWFTPRTWFPDTMFFVDGQGGADTCWIVNDGSYWMFGGDISPYFVPNVYFHSDIYQFVDNKQITMYGWRLNIDIDGDDSLSVITFNNADSIKYDSIGQALWFTPRTWFPDTMFFVDGQTGADTNWIVNTGSNLLFGGDNNEKIGNFTFDGTSILGSDTLRSFGGAANRAKELWGLRHMTTDNAKTDSGGFYHSGTGLCLWADDQVIIRSGSPHYQRMILSATQIQIDQNILGSGDTKEIQWRGEIIGADYDADDDTSGYYFHGTDDYLRRIHASDQFELSADLFLHGGDSLVGMDATNADTFAVWDDGDTTHFDSDNPIKIGGASLVVGTNGLVTIDSLVAKTSAWKYCNYLDAINLSAGGSGATQVIPNANTMGGHNMDADGEYLYMQGSVCNNWDAATDVWICIVWECDVNNGGGLTTDTVEFDLLVYLKGNTETANKSQTLNVRTEIGQSPQYKQFRSWIYIDWDSGTDPVDLGDILSMRLNFDRTNSDITDVIVNLIKFSYQTNVPQLKNY